MDPSSKSPDVEVNCKDEDRKGGAGRRRGGTSCKFGGQVLVLRLDQRCQLYPWLQLRVTTPGDRGASAAFHWERDSSRRFLKTPPDPSQPQSCRFTEKLELQSDVLVYTDKFGADFLDKFPGNRKV